MASSRSPFLICSFSRVRAAPGFSVPGESTGGTTPSPTLRPSVVPEGHHHPLCAILPVCLGQKYSEGCVSPSQQHLHPCELLAATAIPVLVPPAVRGPHGITTELSTLPPAHFSAPQHVARWEHEAFPRAWPAGSPTCSFFAGDIKYDEAMGYPMVQHWRVRSNLYRVKLSSITLSAGEGFQGQGDGCRRGWVVVFCPKRPTGISHLRALFPALLQRQAGRFASFFARGKLRQAEFVQQEVRSKPGGSQ